MKALFLCDLTGRMAEPWAAAGYECICVDTQHSIRRDHERNGIRFVWGDVRYWWPDSMDFAFVAAFPPCTHLAGSGARDWAKKGLTLLIDGLTLVEACRRICEATGAPYLIENPVGRLSSCWRKPDHYFHPYEYAGYLDDVQAENTSKRTCLWTGNGFVMPEKRPAPAPHRQDCWMASPVDDRADLRSATPKGFARAVFEANARIAAASAA